MQGFQALDVAIGLMFIFLLLSLGVTAMNEIVAQMLHSRAATLREGIQLLLNGHLERFWPTFWKARAYQPTENEKALDRARKTLAAARKEYDDAMRTAPAPEAPPPATAGQSSGQSALQGGGGATASTMTATGTTRFTPASDAQPALASAEQEVARLEELNRDYAKLLYHHPLIAGLAQRHLFRRPLPSYIPAVTFSAALLDIIAPSDGGEVTVEALRARIGRLPDQLRKPLLVMLDDAARKAALEAEGRAEAVIENLRKNVESWFENAMVRVSGLFKRKAQLATVLIAVAITVGVNADTLHMTRALASNGALRSALVKHAESSVTDASIRRQVGEAGRADTLAADTTAARDSVVRARLRALQATADSLQTLGLPLGWPAIPDSVRHHWMWAADSSRAKLATEYEGALRRVAVLHSADTASAVTARRALDDYVRARSLTQGLGYQASMLASWSGYRLSDAIARFPGLFITIFAVSLGAPFWFDMLNKVVNIRAAGKAPEDKQTEPRTEPPPQGARSGTK